jgi:hypothetical protein
MVGLIAVGSAGCAEIRTSLPDAAPQQVEWTGTFENGCSPVDAAGIIVELTAPQLDGFIQISMWADESLEPGWRLPLAADDGRASAAFCRATNDCQVATQGEMQILQAEGGTIRGELWLDLPRVGQLQGPFEAQWDDSGPVICG